MFEDRTFDAIQEEMLQDMRDDIDKREGSIAWDATAAVSYRLAEMYFYLQNYPDLVFPDTAVENYLDRTCVPYGIERKKAVCAVRKVMADGSMEIGSRWQIQDVIYSIKEMIREGEYLAQCEQEGDVGNQYSGQLQSLNYSTVGATLGEIVTLGTEKETDEALRKRLIAKIQRPSTSGNVNDYYNWATECDGVGEARVVPLWDGPGTVKVIIVNGDKEPADSALIEAVKEHIESLRPIGAVVTVVSAERITVNIVAKVVLDGTTLSAAQEEFSKAVREYLQDRAFAVTYIGMAKIGTILMEISGVEDYAELSINGKMENLKIQDNQIAVCGSIRLEVSANGN